MTMTPAQALAKLTPAQRRILADLPDDGTFTDAYSVCKKRETRTALNNLGVTEPRRDGPVTCWWLFRPSPLGAGVRLLIERKAPHAP